jgi:imidazolonepropionase-like amidohydrolase
LVRGVLCAALVIAPLASGAGEGALALVGAQVIDGRDRAPSGDTVVVVQGDRILAVGGPEAIPDGAAKIDLDGKTLLPASPDPG